MDIGCTPKTPASFLTNFLETSFCSVSTIETNMGEISKIFANSICVKSAEFRISLMSCGKVYIVCKKGKRLRGDNYLLPRMSNKMRMIQRINRIKRSILNNICCRPNIRRVRFCHDLVFLFHIYFRFIRAN